MKLSAFIATFAVCAASAFAAIAMDRQHVMIGPLRIEQPWTRATPHGAPAGGGYLTISNTGTGDDRLVAAATTRAGKTEIHEMSVTDGVMKMRRLDDGLTIPAGKTVVLKPGGYHIMFMGLAHPIAEGDEVAVTLTFEKAGTIEVVMPAAAIGTKTPAKGHSGHGG